MAYRGTRDFGFFQWVVVGFMLVSGVLAILSIGAPFFLIGLVLLGVTLGRGPRWPAGIGALGGAGLVGVVIGVIGAVATPGLWAAAGGSWPRPAESLFGGCDIDPCRSVASATITSSLALRGAQRVRQPGAQ